MTLQKKSIEMRNSGNDFDYTYFRDALIQRVMGTNCDLDWQPWLPTAFFINGEYKDMLNIRSRTNEDHIYTFYNGEEDIDMFENWGELKEGTWDNFNNLKKFFNEDGHTFDEFNTLMDCGEFANLMIMNLFYDNKDFPGNNIVNWRPRSEGGRWRWIAKDTDFGLGLYDAPYNYKTFNWLYDNDFDPDRAWANKPEHTRLFRALMETPEFHDMFIDRCAVYMGDFMNYRGTVKELDKMYSMIKTEYANHRKLFNEWWPNHSQEVQKMRSWIAARTPFFYTHLSEYFRLGTPRTLTIDAGRTDDIKLTINGITLNNRDFDGKFFAGRQLRIEGNHQDSEMTVDGWKVTITKGTTHTTGSYKGKTLTINMPNADKIEIESIATQSAIADIDFDQQPKALDPSKPFKLYDIQGRLLAEPESIGSATGFEPGIYIARQGSKTLKIILGHQ
ncbi:CotH kinase family protein [Duncaniella muris]|uniref:CotH kinase family protein n=3 Tax=Duncaniella muris TaxID=2094150 RepID=UPI0032B0FE65